jgi:hypothetical protein
MWSQARQGPLAGKNLPNSGDDPGGHEQVEKLDGELFLETSGSNSFAAEEACFEGICMLMHSDLNQAQNEAGNGSHQGVAGTSRGTI